MSFGKSFRIPFIDSSPLSPRDTPPSTSIHPSPALVFHQSLHELGSVPTTFDIEANAPMEKSWVKTTWCWGKNTPQNGVVTHPVC